MENGSVTQPGTGCASSDILWPAGPHYFDLTGSGGAVAWVRYRVWAADWYTRTLRDVVGVEGNYDRLVGVEMALDGALNGISSAFDAGVALLIQGAEIALQVGDDETLPVHRYSWTNARDLLKQPNIGTDPDGTSNDAVWRVILNVDNALDGERTPAPNGWLAQLRRLRNQVAHQETLARHHTAGGPSTVYALGGRETDAFTFLARTCDRVHDLTEQMVALAIRLGAPEDHAGWQRPRWFVTAD